MKKINKNWNWNHGRTRLGKRFGTQTRCSSAYSSPAPERPAFQTEITAWRGCCAQLLGRYLGGWRIHAKSQSQDSIILHQCKWTERFPCNFNLYYFEQGRYKLRADRSDQTSAGGYVRCAKYAWGYVDKQRKNRLLKWRVSCSVHLCVPKKRHD